MTAETLVPPWGDELVAASGAPYRPVPVRYRPPREWHPVVDGELAGRYTYTGAEGEARFEVLRFQLRAGHPAHPDKQFLSRRRLDGGGWAWGLEGVELVPYRLPRVLAAAAEGARVYVVEGERDVHALEEAGLVATCNPLGALQWLERYAHALAGAQVVVVPDEDRAGRVHAGRVLATLRGSARSVRLLLLPGAGRGEDVYDWLARGHTAADLERLADAAPADPPPAAVAALLDLPPGIDPRDTSPAGLRALLQGASAGTAPPPPAPPPADAPFARTLDAFHRLGTDVSAAGSGAHACYRALPSAIRAAAPDLRPLLGDAALLDRACHELTLLAPLVRGLDAAPDAPAEGDRGWMVPPGVRTLRTRWDWDAFRADPALAVPPAAETAYALHLPPEGPLRVRRLHPLALLVLESCRVPLVPKELGARIADAVEGAGDDPARLAALVEAQVRELSGAGLLRAVPRDGAARAVEEARRLLVGGPGALPPARHAAGLLARAAAAAREQAKSVRSGTDGDRDGADALYGMDLCVDGLEQVLSGCRLRVAFGDALDGYWRGGDAAARLDSLDPLVEALERTLDSRTHSPPPLVFA